MANYYVVHFHADGGQCCSPGHRTFKNKNDAKAFAERMKAEPGHSCGPKSVKIQKSKDDKGSSGVIYPGIAASNPPGFLGH